MLSKQLEKYIKSLRQKKHRLETGAFVAEGDKVVYELLHAPCVVEQVLALPSWIDNHEREHNRLGAKLLRINEVEMEKISGLQTPSAVLAIGLMPRPVVHEDRVKRRISLVLDGIQDPGNLGTILRTAAWFGVEDVFCSPDCVDAFNPKVVQSSMGALFRLQVLELPLLTLFEQFPDLPVLAAVLQGEDIRHTPLPAAGFLVIGSEGKGIQENILQRASHKISIPSFSETDSLNAAIATSILLYEWKRN